MANNRKAVIEDKDFEKEYSQKGAYHYRLKGFSLWWMDDNYKMLAGYCKKGTVVLDLACGDGRLYYYLKARGVKEIVGLDISLSAIKLAERLTKMRCMVGSMVDIKKIFAGRLFDIVICSASFQYLETEELRRTLNGINSILRKDGLLVFSYPNDIRITSPKIINFSEWKAILRESGFEVLEKRGICLYMPSFLVSVSSIPILSLVSYGIYQLYHFVSFFIANQSYHYVICSRKGREL